MVFCCTNAPVSFEQISNKSLSIGFILDIFTTLAEIPSLARDSAASIERATSTPHATIVKSIPSLKITPFPISKL